MTPTEYLKQSANTDVKNYETVDTRIDRLDLRILHAQLGIETEAGEITDAIKKYLIYGREIDIVNLKEECGDLLWYIALMLRALNCTFEEVMDMNIAKLKARYPEKFTEEAALNRNLENERKILEGN